MESCLTCFTFSFTTGSLSILKTSSEEVTVKAFRTRCRFFPSPRSPFTAFRPSKGRAKKGFETIRQLLSTTENTQCNCARRSSSHCSEALPRKCMTRVERGVIAAAVAGACLSRDVRLRESGEGVGKQGSSNCALRLHKFPVAEPTEICRDWCRCRRVCLDKKRHVRTRLGVILFAL